MDSPVTPAEVPVPQRYLQELPPRKLDWFTQAVLLFGDAGSQVGWGLLAAGSLVFWISVMQSEARIWLQEQTVNWQSKAGVILKADSTDAVEKRQRIWRYEHSFALEGERYLGESFSVGKKFDDGQIAFISYDPENPSVNFITGLRRSKLSWRVNLLLLIPALGLLFIIAPVRQNLKFLRVLKIGEFTRGKLADKTITNKTVKKGGIDRPVFKYQFQFEYEGVLYLATCRTHQTNLVEDEATEIVLFDKYNPAFNIVYDAVPDAPVISPAGKMQRAPAEKALVLFLPAFVVAVNVVFLMMG